MGGPIVVIIVVIIVFGVAQTIISRVLLNSKFNGSNVRIAVDYPSRGTTNSTYKYRVTLATPANGGTINPAAKIVKITVKCFLTAVISNQSTTTQGFTARQTNPTTGVNNTIVEGPGDNPVQLSYDASPSDLSYIDREMEIKIKSPYTVFFFMSATATIIYKQQVPTPTPSIGGPPPRGVSGDMYD